MKVTINVPDKLAPEWRNHFQNLLKLALHDMNTDEALCDEYEISRMELLREAFEKGEYAND